MQIPHGKFEVLDSFCGLFSAFGGPFKIKHAVFDNGEQFKPEILLERNQFEFKMLSFAWYSFVKILNQNWFRETADKNFFFWQSGAS